MNLFHVISLVSVVLLSHAVNPTDTVIKNSEFFNWIADNMYKLINLVPRVPQTGECQGESITITSFSSVAVGWLATENSDWKDATALLGRYAISIIIVTAVSGAIFLVLLCIMIWWCFKQCCGPKPNPREPPHPFRIFRDKYKDKSRCACRICYFIIAAIVLIGVVIVAVGGILLNTGVKGVFDRTFPIFSNIISIANDLLDPEDTELTGALAAGDGILKVPNGVSHYIAETGNLDAVMYNVDQLRKWVNIQNSLYGITNTSSLEVNLESCANPPNVTLTRGIDWGSIYSGTGTSLTSLEDDCKASGGNAFLCEKAYTKLRCLVDCYLQPYINMLLYASLYSAPTSRAKLDAPATIKANLNTTLDALNSKVTSLDGLTALKTDFSDVDVQVSSSQCTLTSTGVDTALLTAQKLLNVISTSESAFGHTIYNYQLNSNTDDAASYSSAEPNGSTIQQLLTDLSTANSEISGTLNCGASTITYFETVATNLQNKLKPITSGQTKLDSMTIGVDNAFYNVSTTVGRGTRFLGIYAGFVEDYKALYVSYGDVIVYAIAGLFISFGVLTLLSVFCTCLCPKDNLLCCTICCDQIYYLIFGAICVVLCMFSWALMDIYTDLYNSNTLTPFNPLFKKIVSMTYWNNETDTENAAQLLRSATTLGSALSLLSKKSPISQRSTSFVPLSSNAENEKYVVPKVQELLPFENISTSDLGYWFLKSGEGKDTLKTNFIEPLKTILVNVGDNTSKLTPVYGDDFVPSDTFTTAIKELNDTGCAQVEKFTENMHDVTLERSAIRNMLYEVLDPVFINVAHSCCVMWAGTIVMLLFSIPAEFILMCGRTLWQPRRHHHNYNKETGKKTVRQPPKEESVYAEPQVEPDEFAASSSMISSTTASSSGKGSSSRSRHHRSSSRSSERSSRHRHHHSSR